MCLVASQIIRLFLLLSSLRSKLSFEDCHSQSDSNLERYAGENCKRSCEEGENMLCYFQFNIEFYQTMGVACKNCSLSNPEDCNSAECVVGDGFQKGLLSINRKLPGPPIQVCKGDYIVVDVINKAPGTATTIHWHGLKMKNSKFMDGVPYITQCPIPFGTSFRYQFEAEDVGTFFYHSHSGLQKINGLYGAFIVRQPDEQNLHASSYDYDLFEHHLVLSDYIHSYAEFLYPGIPRRLNMPDAVLINGRGTLVNLNGVRELQPPPNVLFVEPNKRYRFRVIGAQSFNCAIQLQVESHNLTIIASDSHDLVPKQFDTLVLNAGERYDFVLNTTQVPGDYWIRVRGLGVCEYYVLTEAFVLLRYKAVGDIDSEQSLPPFPAYYEKYPSNSILNYPNQSESNTYISELQTIRESHDWVLNYARPDINIVLGFKNNNVRREQVFNGHFQHFRNLVDDILEIATINEITNISPTSPLLSQPYDTPESDFCDKHHLPSQCENIKPCPCIHRIKLPLNSIVEMVFVDESAEFSIVHHPIHIHGHDFTVIDIQQRPVIEQANLTHRATYQFNPRPPLKDTVTLPSLGNITVRLRADNPGYWLLHCHYDYHMEIGMALVVQVGENSDMPDTPKDFPKCGNYLPIVKFY